MPLDDPLQFLKGVGPARATALATVGWHTAWDVVHAFPRLLGPPPPLREQGPLPPGEAVRLRARLVSAKPRFGRGRGGMALDATLARADGLLLTAKFFNAGWVRRLLIPGEWFLWEGRTDAAKSLVLLHPAFTHLPGGLAAPLIEETGCRTAYRLPDGVGERVVATLVEQVLQSHLALCRDPAGEIPEAQWHELLRNLHHPPNPLAHEQARRALAARELLALAWTLQQRRRSMVAHAGHAVAWGTLVHERALARLPFVLTPGQLAALADIRADLQQATPMYRLLQGDVGSGKTALALLSALAVIADGGQAALLAPTAVLAQQHAHFITRCLHDSRVTIGLLTGGTPTALREQLLSNTATGTCHLVIGTHALLEASVRFAALRLVIIDEQHKFGVHQRAALVEKATIRPHLLLMTATPIPRTLALTAFGDLALSRIIGRPPGRAGVTTEVVVGGLAEVLAALPASSASSSTSATSSLSDQALIVCALREEHDTIAAHAAEQVCAELRPRFGAAVALLTGAMREEDKLAVMERFRVGDIRVLVSTTVVEVGIDVPTLTVLAVLDADRFGLAQLHQLRGRLGRGTRPGRCLLIHKSTAAATRLHILAASDDGTAIAEADLAERGPGELLGSKQHGVLKLRVADLARDLDLLQDAHQRVHLAIATNPTATMPPTLARWTPAADDLNTGAG